MRKALLISILALLGAGSLATAGEYYTKHKNEAKQFGEPTDDMALVYVIRSAKIGAAIKTWAFYDDAFIGVSRSKGYAFALVPPGERMFWSKAENISVFTLEVQAGKTYYFKQKIMPGVGKARVKLVPLEEAQAQKLLKKCGYTEVTEAGRQRAAEIIRQRLDRVERKAAKKTAKAEG